MPSSVATLDDLPANTVITVREASERVRLRMRRTAEDIVEIGRDLILIKETLRHGSFLPWIEQEFGMTARTAQNFMGVAEQFGDKYETVSHLPPKVLYALAAPSTPEEVRDNVVEMAKRGDRVTTKTVTELKEKLKAAEQQIKEERETRSMIESRSREVMAERDEANQKNLMLESQIRQLNARQPDPPPAAQPREPEVLPPVPVDVNLMSMLALWEQSGPATRQAFLKEIRAT
jgi:hypothetical protein